MTAMFSVKSYGKAKLAVLEKQKSSRGSPYADQGGSSLPRLTAPSGKPAPWKAPLAPGAGVRKFSAPPPRPSLFSDVREAEAEGRAEEPASAAEARRRMMRNLSSGAGGPRGSAKREEESEEADVEEEGDEESLQCMVYVGNMSYKANYRDLEQHMSQVGSIVFVRVNEDKNGSPAGSGCVRYETPGEAQRAIDELNGSKMRWRELAVEPWTGKVGRRPGWNQIWRDLNFGTEPEAVVFVGHLGWRMKSWQVRQHMEQAGPVAFCRVLTDNDQPWGNSKGIAFVRYASAADGRRARETLHGSELLGQKLHVDAWGEKLEPFQAPSDPIKFTKQS